MLAVVIILIAEKKTQGLVLSFHKTNGAVVARLLLLSVEYQVLITVCVVR